MLTHSCWLFVFFLTLVGCNDEQGEFGRFEGEVKTEWLENGSSMRLLEDFHYIGPENDRWTAPAGDIIDGASIPRGLWTIVGAPFDGLYRKASVIHDVGCVRRTRSMEDTHRAFYYACRLGGGLRGEGVADVLGREPVRRTLARPWFHDDRLHAGDAGQSHALRQRIRCSS